MQYALLAYAPVEETDRAARPVPDTLAAVLAQPNVTGWARLHADESATTLRNDGGRMLLTGSRVLAIFRTRGAGHLPRRHRTGRRRGRRGVRHRRRALAPRRGTGQSHRLADHDRA